MTKSTESKVHIEKESDMQVPEGNTLIEQNNDPKTKLKKIWRWATEHPIKFLTAVYVIQHTLKNVHREAPLLIENMRAVRDLNTEADWGEILNDSDKSERLIRIINNDIVRGNDIDQTTIDEVSSYIVPDDIVEGLAKRTSESGFIDLYDDKTITLLNKIGVDVLLQRHNTTSKKRDVISKQGMYDWLSEERDNPENVKHPLHRYMNRGFVGMTADKIYRVNKIKAKHPS
jgi:hypothetical protein